MLIFWEIVVLLVLLAAFCRLPPGLARWQHLLGRRFAQLARHRGWCVLLVGVLAFAGCVLTALVTTWPEPHYTDEFSYLLAGDTFAHGRLTNPPHPHWAHFESFHVIQQPTYASKYPPAQGLALAVGQILTGQPIVGVWLSVSLACMALCWMLQAWLPPRWALLGALLGSVRLVFWGHPFSPDDLQPAFWSQGYLGGAMSALGGALVFGGLRRLVAQPRVTSALLLGLGLVILAGSRPWEGAAASLPAAILLLAWMLGKSGPSLRMALTRVVLPVGLVLGIGGAALLVYNHRVTGSPLRMPYQVHEAAYASTPSLLWQSLPPRPAYRHVVFEENYLGWWLQEYERQQHASGLLLLSAGKLGKVIGFYLGVGLLLPLIGLRHLLRDPWTRFALLTCVVELIALLLTTGGLSHYVAPITGLLLVLAVQALRQLRLGRWRGQMLGRAYVRALAASYLVLLVLSVFIERRATADARHEQRASILRQLSTGPAKHLVLVRYEPKPLGLNHEEWVYNGADIDGAPVVWAREMGPREDAALVEYFHDRTVWRVDADASPPRLEPYSPPASEHSSCTDRASSAE